MKVYLTTDELAAKWGHVSPTVMRDLLRDMRRLGQVRYVAGLGWETTAEFSEAFGPAFGPLPGGKVPE